MPQQTFLVMDSTDAPFNLLIPTSSGSNLFFLQPAVPELSMTMLNPHLYHWIPEKH